MQPTCNNVALSFGNSGPRSGGKARPRMWDVGDFMQAWHIIRDAATRHVPHTLDPLVVLDPSTMPSAAERKLRLCCWLD
jgi:hypothetical protein